MRRFAPAFAGQTARAARFAVACRSAAAANGPTIFPRSWKHSPAARPELILRKAALSWDFDLKTGAGGPRPRVSAPGREAAGQSPAARCAASPAPLTWRDNRFRSPHETSAARRRPPLAPGDRRRPGRHAREALPRRRRHARRPCPAVLRRGAGGRHPLCGRHHRRDRSGHRQAFRSTPGPGPRSCSTTSSARSRAPASPWTTWGGCRSSPRTSRFYAEFNEVYRTYFKGPMPARAFLGAARCWAARISR